MLDNVSIRNDDTDFRECLAGSFNRVLCCHVARLFVDAITNAHYKDGTKMRCSEMANGSQFGSNRDLGLGEGFPPNRGSSHRLYWAGERFCRNANVAE